MVRAFLPTFTAPAIAGLEPGAHASADLCPSTDAFGGEIGQRSALTGQVSAPSDGLVTIFPPDPDFEALRLELARLRAAHGWTYDELAARSGLARRTLIEIEQGRTIGTLKTWHALAHALGTPLDQLFGALCSDHESPGLGQG